MSPTSNTPVFELINTINGVRNGIITTRAGKLHTPLFMPVGTRGAVKGLTLEMVASTNAQIILGNTYHLHLQPGEDVINKLGGLHEFTRWQKPILTDSGGFQVFSLGHINKITDEGVSFKDPKTGDIVFLTPEKAIQIQILLGSDIIMAFDDVVGLDDVSRKREKQAFERTHRWLERCVKEFKLLTQNMLPPGSSSSVQADAVQGTGEQRSKSYKSYGVRAAQHVTQNSTASTSRVISSDDKQVGMVNRREKPLLFGIAQGGLDKNLRKKSLEMVQALPVDGIAIGGLSVGESRADMHDMLDYLQPIHDPFRPHYLMGIGDPTDMRYAIERGIDMFDCVLPTRNARHGTAWVRSDCTASSCQHAKPAAPKKLEAQSGVEFSGIPSSYEVYDSVHSSDSPSSVSSCNRCGKQRDEKIHLTNARFIDDSSVLDPNCDCYTCKSGYSKGFLCHQFKSKEPLAGSLVSIHNIRYLERICEEYRSKV